MLQLKRDINDFHQGTSMAKPPVSWPVWLMLALASQDLWKFVVAPAGYGVTTPQLIQLVLPRKMGILLQEFLDVDFVGSVQWSRSSHSLRATPGWERICWIFNDWDLGLLICSNALLSQVVTIVYIVL